jgi:hypothetical protein
MTSSTTEIQSANGGTTTPRTDPKPRERGLAVLRRKEAESLLRVILDALYETQSLTSSMDEGLYDAAYGVIPHAPLGRQLLEALACLETADHYLRMLDGVIDTGEPLSEAPIPLR